MPKNSLETTCHRMDLPPTFTRNILAAFGERGRQYLQDLPGLLASAAARWDLTLGDPCLLSYNYVCRACRADGSAVILKVGVPDPELSSEINALLQYAGQGACALLDADAGAGMLLLEQLLPGTMLTQVEDDDQSTRIAVGLLASIQIQPVQQAGFLSLRKWFDGLQGLRPRFGGGTGPYPKDTVVLIEGLLGELFSENRPAALLHGDFHHYNILLSQRGWLVIDPKGVIGAAEYEAGPYLTNPWDQVLDVRAALQRTRRRIAIFSEMLGWEPGRIWRWALCHSLLSSWWDVAEDGTGGDRPAAWMEIFASLRSEYE